MFQNLLVFFVNLGSLNKARIQILSKKIKQKGGLVKDAFSESMTHVITEDNISCRKIRNFV
jgi:hypothetical protein